MKKLKKELNKTIKVFLALGLLFNNLMPLSMVFADEVDNTEDTAIVEKTDDEAVLPSENNEGSENKEEDPMVETNTDEGEGEENLGEGETTPEEPVEDATNEVTFVYEVYVDDAKFEDDYGWVELDKEVSKVDIIAKLSGVEATEDYKFTFEGNEYTTEELLNGVVVKTITFDGYLYGVFNLETSGTLTDPEGTATPYDMSYIIEHGTDADNDEALSAVNDSYIFHEGVLTAADYDEDTLTGIVKEAFPNVTVAFEDNEVCLSDDNGVIVWYSIVTKGDVNDDGKINEEDLELLVNQVLGLEEATEKSDVNGDGEVNDLDAAYLKLMLETGYTEDVTEDDAVINAKFGEFNGPVKVGDEFTLDYVVTLSEYTINGISGLVKYDKNLLELVSAEAKLFDIGDMNEDKFLYLGKYLELDIEPVEDEEGNMLFDEDGSPMLTFNDTDYVVITLTFKALAAGNATVSMDEVKYFDFAYYYTADGDTSIDVTIEEDENEEDVFTSITVSGYQVDLNTYELTVPNDVTTLDLEYVLADEKYNVTSVAAPEELAEGENTIVITVMDENGEEKTYTIKVTREATEAEKEAAVEPVNYQEPTYSNDDNDNEKSSETVAPTTSDDEEVTPDEKDNGKLSRVIIIILILLAIAGLIYLIFKDDKDDEETKKANREIDKLKREDNNKNRKLDNDKKVKKKER